MISTVHLSYVVWAALVGCSAEQTSTPATSTAGAGSVMSPMTGGSFNGGSESRNSTSANGIAAGGYAAAAPSATGGLPVTSSSSGGTGGTAGGTTAHACENPVFTTSDKNGGTTMDGYYVHNNMWNSDYALGPETLYACAYSSWYVVSNQTNEQGAVKTYPNVHKDYDDVPITSFARINSNFAATSPHVGIYNVAYDIWLNGVATAGCTEVMIWTDNFKQVPAGNQVGTTALGGVNYAVWRTSNGGYVAFVPDAPIVAGTLDLLGFLNYLVGKGWLRANSTLGQICYGVEIVSTDGRAATFEFTDFSISDT